ncbi:hypothetical protein [Natronomonas sp. EA1]|uniref:hypothetical protein n=1 Tax=Natronomonas sp. EA1 TaxID=3421655 RepID=UPI003EBDD89B
MGSHVRRGSPPFEDVRPDDEQQDSLGEFLSEENQELSLGEFLSGRFSSLDIDPVEEVRTVRRREKE